MNMPYKVSVFYPKDKDGNLTGEPPRYSISVSFYGMEKNPKVQQCYDKFMAFNEAYIDAAFQNHEEWFDGKYSGTDETKLRIILEAMLRGFVKFDTKHKKYPPVLKFTLPCYDGEFGMEIYDENQKDAKGKYVLVKFGDNIEEGEVDITKFLGKGTSVLPLIRIPKLNFIDGKYGSSPALVQARVKPSTSFMGTCMLSDSEDDEDQDNTAQNGSDEEENVYVVDSDEENGEDVVVDEDDDEEEPSVFDEPEPAPAPAKKTTRRKRTTKKTN